MIRLCENYTTATPRRTTTSLSTKKLLIISLLSLIILINLVNGAPTSSTTTAKFGGLNAFDDKYNLHQQQKQQHELQAAQKEQPQLDDEDVIELEELKKNQKSSYINNKQNAELLPNLENQLESIENQNLGQIIDDIDEQNDLYDMNENKNINEQQQQQDSSIERDAKPFIKLPGSTIVHHTIVKSSTTEMPSTTTATTFIKETNKFDDIIEKNLIKNNQPGRITTDIKNPESLLRHSGGQYSAFDMAQYVFWTGDEAGVARAVEEFIQEGLMTRENAIKFLRDIRLGIEYLQNSYVNRPFPGAIKGKTEMLHGGSTMSARSSSPVELSQTGELSPTTMYPAAVAADSPKTTITSPTTTTTIKPTTERKILQIKPTLSPIIQKALEKLPTLMKLNEMNERKDENAIDYDEMAGRLRLADFLYAEYSLEEVIYQLAKVMFSQSLTHGSEQAQGALQRLTGFLESEGAHGRISPALQKKVLDVLLAALSDTLAEHPELLNAARVSLGNSINQLPKQQSIDNKQ